jgi:hypothetical protein
VKRVQFKNDEDFASNIQNNTPRYVRHFEEVVDDLLPPTTLDGAHGGDIFDFLQVPHTAFSAIARQQYILCIHRIPFENLSSIAFSFRTSLILHRSPFPDTMQAQRLEQLQRVADPAAMPTQADTPHSLVRRYEVSIIPFAAAKARKLREIKAVGTSLHILLVAHLPMCVVCCSH